MAYLALRKVWSEWDRGDPGDVEETLHDVALDASAPPPIRAYAGVARGVRPAAARRPRRRARAHRPPRDTSATGWLVGPFDNDGKVGPRRGVRPREGARAPAQPDARLRRQEPQAGPLAAPPAGVALRVGRLRRRSSAPPSRPASTRRRSCATRASSRPRRGRSPSGPARRARCASSGTRSRSSATRSTATSTPSASPRRRRCARGGTGSR